MIQLYGSPRTSAGRCYWMLEEIGQPYHPIPLDLLDRREQRDPAYLALNPNGKIPCLVDGDVTLWESMAINQYLGERYRPELLGTDPGTRGRVAQWTHWALVDLQPPLIDILIQTHFVPEARRNPDVIARAQAQLPSLLRILDEALAGAPFLTGPDLTVADFNVASVYHITRSVSFPTADYPRAESWYGQMMARPSARRWIELRGGR